MKIEYHSPRTLLAHNTSSYDKWRYSYRYSSAVYGDSDQLYAPATLSLVALDRSWVDSRAGLYAAEKRQSLAPDSNCTQIPQ